MIFNIACFKGTWKQEGFLNGQVKVGEVKEYVQDGAVGMAAEGGEKYSAKNQH